VLLDVEESKIERGPGEGVRGDGVTATNRSDALHSDRNDPISENNPFSKNHSKNIQETLLFQKLE
jgi:hypothetical protein